MGRKTRPPPAAGPPRWAVRLKRCVSDVIALQTALPLEMVAHALIRDDGEKQLSAQEYATRHGLERKLGLAVEQAGLLAPDKPEPPDALARLHEALLAQSDAKPRSSNERLERELSLAMATAMREGAPDLVMRVGELLVLAAGGHLPSPRPAAGSRVGSRRPSGVIAEQVQLAAAAAAASAGPSPAAFRPPVAAAAALSPAAAAPPAAAAASGPPASASQGGTRMPVSRAAVTLEELGAAVTAQSDLAMADLQLGGEIAEGQFASVCRGLLYGQKVAVKQLKQEEGKTDADLVEELRWEVGVMSTLRHPSLVALLGVTDQFRIVLEFREGTLYDALQGSLGGAAADGGAVRQMMADVLGGLAYLHTRPQPIVHRDLKPPNVLCDARRHCKLADFGTAQVLRDAGARLDECVGTALYMAPEVERGDAYGLAADVFSFGVMLYECYYYLDNGEDFYNGDFALFTGMEAVRTPLGEEPPRAPDRPAACADDEWALVAATLAAGEAARPAFVDAARAWSAVCDAHSGGTLAKWLKTG